MQNARQMPQINFRIPSEIKSWVKEEARKERMSVASWLVRLIEKNKEAIND